MTVDPSTGAARGAAAEVSPGTAAGEVRAVRRVLAGEPVVDVAEAEALAPSHLAGLVAQVLEVEAAVASSGRPAGVVAAPGPVDPAPTISVVVPVYNEEDNIPALLGELLPILRDVGTYEVVFVDDCSTDGSREAVLAARADDPCIELVELARNFGHQAALTAGLDHARGEAVVMMDADLQDPPSLLPELVARWRDGDEVVYAVRRNRKEHLVLRGCFYLFYRLQRRVSDIDLPLDSGDFALIDRRVADAMRSLPERSRFLRGLRGWVGFRQVGVEYDRPARLHGETKYSARALFRLAGDGLLAFSSLPLRLASFGGFLTTASAFVYLLIALVSLVGPGDVPQGWTSLMFVTLLLGGTQLTMTGIVGEYLARTYHEAKGRPPYIVRDRHGAALVATAQGSVPAPT